MTKTEIFKEIAASVQLFSTLEEKEKFIFVIGALASRLITLQKAAEIMDIDRELLLNILDLMGINFSYLSNEDIVIEREW